jgi:hypothetical protein
MALIDRVKTVLSRLAPQGWQALFNLHGLDITASDLKMELGRQLIKADGQTTIDRNLPGFEDFALEGDRGVVPGQPARSLLFHALASPNVVKGVNGVELLAFPTLAELEMIENYVFGANPPSLLDLRARFPGATIAIVVFAAEYRPAAETVHRKHADFCCSRTGVARVGTAPAVYLPKNRGFLPFVDGDNNAIRILPARYAAYIAIQRKGDPLRFGPMRPQNEDSNLDFWVPIHKLFNGTECLRGLDLTINLKTNHVNEKLRRIHLEFGRRGIDGGWREPDISQSPFIFRDGIAEWATDANLGSGLLVPTVHPALVEAGIYQGKPLTYRVSPNPNRNLSSSLTIEAQDDFRQAPEYVHARHLLRQNGVEENLNDRQDVAAAVERGNYRARHYLDFTGDGWIDAECPQLATEINRRVPAYSLVTAPDFFPNCDQRELLEWTETSVPTVLRNNLWRIPPETLADGRFAPNLQLVGANFRPEDKTVTAIVSLPQVGVVQPTRLDLPTTVRHAYLPDAAASVFQPGWDVSLSRTQTIPQTPHLAAYGLGSPFPEDAKLCAALSTFWPGVAPDATRTFQPSPSWPTVSPMTDEEIGQSGSLPWDGIPGSKTITVSNRRLVEYADFDHADYVETALQNKFSLALTGKVDVQQYEFRVLAMARVYRVLGLNDIPAKASWSVNSFRQAGSANGELQQAQTQAGATLQGNIFRFELYRHGTSTLDSTNPRKRRVQILETATFFVDSLQILLKRGSSNWTLRNG